jgi:PII-like signaling protein
VNSDCLKLTSYFGERQRTEGRFTADALLGLYGRHEIAASILLRGTEGFGLRQRTRTDRSLTLSEDLPLVAVAVDTRARIEAIAGDAVRLTGSGLVTLERARMLDGDIAPVNLLDTTKLTIYLGRTERVYRVPAYVAVCDLLHRGGIAGATVLLGVDGTAHGQRQRAAFFSRNTQTPVMVISVGSAEQISRVVPELGALLRRPLLTLERVTICKRDGELLSTPAALPETDQTGTAQTGTAQTGTAQTGTAQTGTAQTGTAQTGTALWHKLMVYTSEAGLCEGQPIHRTIVRRLREAGISGATTLRGVWGFHGDHQPHGDRLLQAGRRVPAVTVVVDTPERIATAFPVIDELTAQQGLVTSETVPAIRAGTAHR